MEISFVRKVLPDNLPLVRLVEDAIKAERLILGHEHDLDLVTFDDYMEVTAHDGLLTLLLASNKVLAEVDCDGVVAAEPRLRLRGEKVELLPLALELGCPSGSRYAHSAISLHFLHLAVRHFVSFSYYRFIN